jgi:hypothetical protein
MPNFVLASITAWAAGIVWLSFTAAHAHRRNTLVKMDTALHSTCCLEHRLEYRFACGIAYLCVAAMILLWPLAYIGSITGAVSRGERFDYHLRLNVRFPLLRAKKS